jgi:hypothetical protein
MKNDKLLAELARTDLQSRKDEILKELEGLDSEVLEILKDKGCRATVEDGLLKPQFEYAKPIQKADQSRSGNRFEPDADELALINQKALGTIDGKDLKASDVVSLTIRAAASESPSDDDIINPDVLEFLAADAKEVGLPVLLASYSDEKDHTRKAINTKGIVYDAYVKDNTLFYKAYFPKSARNTPYIEDILNGLYTKTSVGFFMNPADYHCSSCRISMADKACPHQVGDYMPNGQRIKGVITKASRNAEISLVATPARTESRALKMSESEDNIVDKNEQDRLEAVGAKALLKFGQDGKPEGIVAPIVKLEENANCTAVGSNSFGAVTSSDAIAVGISNLGITELGLDVNPLAELKSEMELEMSKYKEEIELLKSKLADRINSESTILDNTMSEEKKDDVSKELGQINVPALPDVGGDAEVKPAVDSHHQVIEPPKHIDLKKEAEDALAKLESIAKNIDEIPENAKKDKHLAILGYMTEVGSKLEKGLTDLVASNTSLINKVSDLEAQVKSQAKEKTIEQAIESGKASSQVVQKSPNQALLDRLLIKE